MGLTQSYCNVQEGLFIIKYSEYCTSVLGAQFQGCLGRVVEHD